MQLTPFGHSNPYKEILSFLAFFLRLQLGVPCIFQGRKGVAKKPLCRVSLLPLMYSYEIWVLCSTQCVGLFASYKIKLA